MNVRHLTGGIGMVLMLAGALITMSTPSTASASRPSGEPKAILLVAGLQGAIGSTIGPDGALYVTEGVAGRISRVDSQTGHITTFASGLPARIVGIGGAMDVAFIGKTAYVLVTLVGPDVGGSDVVGIYRVDGLSQGDFPPDAGEGSPALEDTGALVEVNGGGTFTVITDGLNQPTSLEFIGNTAYIITLTGEIWKIDGVSGRHYGSPR
jgi:hypothetical protein